MAYTLEEARIGLPPLLSITSVASVGVLNSTAVPVGTIVRAKDPVFGQGEFIYLPGVAANTVGSIIVYNPTAGTATLTSNTPTYAPRPLAVSMAANTSTTALSWYQITGAAVIKKTAIKVNPSVAVYLSSTAGRVTSTAASGLQMESTLTINTATVASATSTITVVMQRPDQQGSKN